MNLVEPVVAVGPVLVLVHHVPAVVIDVRAEEQLERAAAALRRKHDVERLAAAAGDGDDLRRVNDPTVGIVEIRVVNG